MGSYLFVLTRDLTRDRSASYVARSAAALSRRSHAVTVFLIDDAVRALFDREWASTADDGRARAPYLLASVDEAARVLADAGVRVLADLGDRDTRGNFIPWVGLEQANEDTLAALLLTPGVTVRWC